MILFKMFALFQIEETIAIHFQEMFSPSSTTYSIHKHCLSVGQQCFNFSSLKYQVLLVYYCRTEVVVDVKIPIMLIHFHWRMFYFLAFVCASDGALFSNCKKFILTDARFYEKSNSAVLRGAPRARATKDLLMCWLYSIDRVCSFYAIKEPERPTTLSSGVRLTSASVNM